MRISAPLLRLASLVCGAVVCAVAAPPPILPIKEVHAGMKAVGRTVFSGTNVENFDVEVLGVLENVGPRQSLILARLSGGPLEKTGVMQGMSGSPVYYQGKLMGAVAMAFQFAKEPIAGIRPIEEMLASNPEQTLRPEVRASLSDQSLTARLPKVTEASAGNPVQIATPLSLAGFTRGTVEQFTSALRVVGLEPRQGISTGRAAKPEPPKPPEPGSMISLQLVNGDMAVGADGTVTMVDGNRVWAFGHRFLAVGDTELPFTNASVITLLANLNTSAKISASGALLGTITGDYNAAVSGELGRSARMAQVKIALKGATRSSNYRMEMVQDRILSPLLLQMMCYSAIDGSERTLGTSSVRISGAVRFEGTSEPVTINNVYSGDFNTPMVASLGVALPVAYALQNTLEPLRVQDVDLTVETMPEKRQFSIDQVWTEQKEVRPGDSVDIHVLLTGEGNRELARVFRYTVPVGAPAGTWNITVADGPSTNAGEGRAYNVSQSRPAKEVLTMLNSMRSQNRGYVRIWRNDAGYSLDGRELPAPPASVGLLLAKAPGVAPNPGRGSTVAEMSFDAGDAPISGAKTITVEVKE